METDDKGTSDITVDDVLKVLGPYGKFTIYNSVMIMIPVFLAGMYASVYNFESMDLEYRCVIPECANDPTSDQFSMPQDNDGVPKKCLRYALRNVTDDNNVTSSYMDNNSTTHVMPVNKECLSQNFDTTKEIQCTSFVYLEQHSIVKEFNLACQDWKRSLVGTAHNAGYFFSTPITGLFSDSYGRRLAVVVACIFNGIGIIRALVFNYEIFLSLEFLEVAFGGGLYAASFVHAMELVGPKDRVFMSLLINMFFLFGGVAVAGLYWWLQNWRYLIFSIYAPAFLGFIYIWTLTESFRWLLSQGRYEDALKILKNSEKMNKVTVPKEYYDQIEKTAIKTALEEAKNTGIQVTESRLIQILKSTMIWKRLLTCSFLLITSTLVYYGLSINAIELTGNRYLNFVLVTLVEAPANICKLLFLDTYGRKKVISVAFFLTGLILFSFAIVPVGTWSIVVYLGGKFFVTLAFNSLYVFAAEVFPTNYRTFLLAVCLTIGRIGSAVAPLTPLLMKFSAHLPTTLFGVMTVISSLLVLTLPETNNLKLPDSLEEAREQDKPRKCHEARTKL